MFNTNIENDQILVVCDVMNNELYNMQLVTKAYELGKELGKKIYVLFLSSKVFQPIINYSDYGVDLVIYVNEPLEALSQYQKVCYQCIKDIQPSLVMFCSDSINRAIASYVSVKAQSGLIADCINFAVKDVEVVFTRTANNDLVMADITCINSKICLCTVKKDCINVKKVKNCQKAEIIEYKIKQNIYEKKFDAEYISSYIKEQEKNDVFSLDKKLVIGVGRGGYKYLDDIKIFAQKVNAGIGVSKPLVEEQFISNEYQIGQSGKLISPYIYISLGISGMSQHMVGIQNARTIIAVNTDHLAPIVSFSDYFVCADVGDFIHDLLRKI